MSGIRTWSKFPGALARFKELNAAGFGSFSIATQLNNEFGTNLFSASGVNGARRYCGTCSQFVPIKLQTAAFNGRRLSGEKLKDKLTKFDQAIPVAQRKQLHELDMLQDCRWPVGKPRTEEFFYCGGQRVEGRHPYCAHHMKQSGRIAGQQRANWGAHSTKEQRHGQEGQQRNQEGQRRW